MCRVHVGDIERQRLGSIEGSVGGTACGVDGKCTHLRTHVACSLACGTGGWVVVVDGRLVGYRRGVGSECGRVEHIAIDGRRVASPRFQYWIRRYGGVEHPLGDEGTIGFAHRSADVVACQFSLTVEDVAVELVAVQQPGFHLEGTVVGCDGVHNPVGQEIVVVVYSRIRCTCVYIRYCRTSINGVRVGGIDGAVEHAVEHQCLQRARLRCIEIVAHNAADIIACEVGKTIAIEHSCGMSVLRSEPSDDAACIVAIGCRPRYSTAKHPAVIDTGVAAGYGGNGATVVVAADDNVDILEGHIAHRACRGGKERMGKIADDVEIAIECAAEIRDGGCKGRCIEVAYDLVVFGAIGIAAVYVVEVGYRHYRIG